MICVGHSNMVCVLEALRDADEPFEAVVLGDTDPHVRSRPSRRLIASPGEDALGDEAKAALADAEGAVFAFVGGARYDNLALRRLVLDPDEPLFDFVLPESPSLPLAEGAEIVPYDAVRAVVWDDLHGKLRLLREVAAATDAPVFQFEFPPPAGDGWLAAFSRRKGWFVDTGLPPRLVRYKLWRVSSELVRELTAELGVGFVESPPDAADEEGFMRDELVRNMTHGDTAYGALVLEQMKALA